MSDNLLSNTEVRSIVRLLGATAAIQGNHRKKKSFLMDGLCQLVSANSWAWALGCKITPGGPQMYIGIHYGGFTQEGYPKLLKALDHPDMGEITKPFFLQCYEQRDIVTMTREEIDPLGLFLKSDAKQMWEEAGVGNVMMCGYNLGDDSLSTAAFYRESRESYTEKEKYIIQIVMEEVTWLHMLGWPEDKGATIPHLYPRQRTVLNLMLDGMSRKEIAAHLGISESTVSGYTKEVYQHFRVHSHVELISKFLR